jgi:salicylate hydroxylase
MSHVLGKVKSPQQLVMAFEIFDSIRRPRAQKVVQTSFECGSIYSLSHPDFEDDITRIAINLNRRFLWIWEHDLEVDLKKADVMFEMLTASI